MGIKCNLCILEINTVLLQELKFVLGVTAAVASGNSTGQCAEYVASSNFSQAATTTGKGGFDRFVNGSNYYPPFNTVDSNVVGLFFNGTTNLGNSTVSFFNNFSKGDTVSIEYGAKTTYFEITSIGYGQGGVNAYINVSYISGDLNYSITVGDTYNVCKI